MGDLIYVLIFAFAPDGEVLLRKKTHPTAQAGAWNGIGGKKNDIDEGCRLADHNAGTGYCDVQIYTLTRKFREETGLEIEPSRFKGDVLVRYPEADLHVFWVDLDDAEVALIDIHRAGQSEDGEYNCWFSTEDLIDMVNRDWDAELVESTWEYLELIKSFRYRWDEKTEAPS